MSAGVYIPLALRADYGKATYPFAVGDLCRVVSGVIVREGEDLETSQLGKLSHDSKVEILQIGSGPTGKRVLVRDESGQQGWVSVVAESGEEKLQVVQRGKPTNALCDEGAAADKGGSSGTQEQQQEPRHDQGKPTEKFQVDDEYEVMHGIQLRKEEDLNSPQVKVLPNKSRVKVVKIGTGPTGRRICVNDGHGREGWVSVVAANGEPLLRHVPKRQPDLSRKQALAAAGKASSGQLAAQGIGTAPVKCIEVVVRWQDGEHAMDMLQKRLRMEGIMQFDGGSLCVVDSSGKAVQPSDGAGVWARQETFPLTFRFQPSQPYALQLVMEALQPPTEPQGPREALAEKLREAAANGDLAGARRAAQEHVNRLAAEANRRPVGPPAASLAKAPAGRPSPGTALAKAPPVRPCPPGFQPFEHLGVWYEMRSADGLIFEPGNPIPMGVWNGLRQRAEPVMGKTDDNPHTQIMYFGKSYVLLHGSKLFDPDTQQILAILNRETLQIERTEPIPIAVSSFLEQKGFSLQSMASSSQDSPFIQILRQSPLEAVTDRKEALEALSEGSWKMLRFASSELRGDRELVLKAVQGDRGPESWKMLMYAAQSFQRDPEIVLEAVKKDLGALRLADPALLENRDFMLDVVQEHGLALGHASEELRADHELACAAVQQSWQALRYVAEELLDDRGLIEIAVGQSWRALELAGEECRADRKLVELAVEQSWCSLQFAAESLRRDPDLISMALRQSPDALHYAAPELRRDLNFMLEAVQTQGMALRFAAEELRSDRSVVSAAVQQSAHALKYASSELAADRDVVLEAVRQDPEAIKHAAKELLADPEVVLACVSQNSESLDNLPEELRANRAFMLEVVRLHGTALKVAVAELRSDHGLVLEAVRQNWRALKYATEELCADRAFVLEAVQTDGMSLAFAAEKLRADPELVLEAARHDVELLEYAATQLCADQKFMLQAVRLNGLALKFAALKLRADHELVKEAVSQHGLALEYATEELRGDRDIVLAAVGQDPKALSCATEALRADCGFTCEVVRQSGLALQFAADIPRADARVVLEAMRQNWRALKYAARELRADRDFMLEAVRINGLALSLAVGEVREDPELLFESTRDPMTKMDHSAFAWPAGMAIAKLPQAGVRSKGTTAHRVSGLPLTAFASVAPDAENLGPEELLSVVLRQMGACAGSSSSRPAGVLDAALDTLQPRMDAPAWSTGQQQLTAGSQGEKSTAPGAGESTGSAGSTEGGEAALRAASTASGSSTACTEADTKAAGPAVPKARRAPNARVIF